MSAIVKVIPQKNKEKVVSRFLRYLNEDKLELRGMGNNKGAYYFAVRDKESIGYDVLLKKLMGILNKFKISEANSIIPYSYVYHSRNEAEKHLASLAGKAN